MISWIQEVLIKNGKVIFSLLLIVIIFAFVIAFTPGQGGFGNTGGSTELGYYGNNLASRKEVGPIQDRTLMSLQLDDQSNISQEQFQVAYYQRMAFLYYADQLGIPEPNDDEIQQQLREKPAFNDTEGNFDPDALASFLDGLETNPNLSQDTLTATLVEDYRIDRLQKALAGPGFALPFEAAQQNAFQRTRFSADVATIDLSGFEPEIDATEENLRAFYDEAPRNYEEPEKVEVSIIKFSQGDFTEEAGQPTEAEIAAWWERNKARFTKPAAVPGDAPVPPTLEDHRAEAVLGAAAEKGKPYALAAAEEFAYALYRAETPIVPGTDAFNELVSKHKGNIVDVPPFSQDRPPFRAGITGREMAKAFELNEQSFYSQIPLSARDGAGILIYKGKVEPTIPPYEEVAERVKTDYENDARDKALLELEEAIKAQLTEAMDAGKTLAEAAETVETAEVSVESFESFTLFETPEGFDRSLAFSLMNMEVGSFGELNEAGDTGTMLYLSGKEVEPVDYASADFQQQFDRLKEQNAFGAFMATMNELMQAELIKSGIIEDPAANADEI